MVDDVCLWRMLYDVCNSAIVLLCDATSCADQFSCMVCIVGVLTKLSAYPVVFKSFSGYKASTSKSDSRDKGKAPA